MALATMKKHTQPVARTSTLIKAVQSIIRGAGTKDFTRNRQYQTWDPLSSLS